MRVWGREKVVIAGFMKLAAVLEWIRAVKGLVMVNFSLNSKYIFKIHVVFFFFPSNTKTLTSGKDSS